MAGKKSILPSGPAKSKAVAKSHGKDEKKVAKAVITTAGKTEITADDKRQEKIAGYIAKYKADRKTDIDKLIEKAAKEKDPGLSMGILRQSVLSIKDFPEAKIYADKIDRIMSYKAQQKDLKDFYDITGCNEMLRDRSLALTPRERLCSVEFGIMYPKIANAVRDNKDIGEQIREAISPRKGDLTDLSDKEKKETEAVRAIAAKAVIDVQKKTYAEEPETFDEIDREEKALDTKIYGSFNKEQIETVRDCDNKLFHDQTPLENRLMENEVLRQARAAQIDKERLIEGEREQEAIRERLAQIEMENTPDRNDRTLTAVEMGRLVALTAFEAELVHTWAEDEEFQKIVAEARERLDTQIEKMSPENERDYYVMTGQPHKAYEICSKSNITLPDRKNVIEGIEQQLVLAAHSDYSDINDEIQKINEADKSSPAGYKREELTRIAEAYTGVIRDAAAMDRLADSDEFKYDDLFTYEDDFVGAVTAGREQINEKVKEIIPTEKYDTYLVMTGQESLSKYAGKQMEIEDKVLAPITERKNQTIKDYEKETGHSYSSRQLSDVDISRDIKNIKAGRDPFDDDDSITR